MSKTLYEISQDEQALFALLEETEGEVTEETEAAFDQFFAEIEADLNKKVDGYCGFIRRQLSEAKILKEEAARLSAKATVSENLANRLKARLKLFVESRGGSPIKTTFNSLKLTANGGKTPVKLKTYYVNNPVELPEKYRKVEFKPDLEKIREDLEKPDFLYAEDILEYAELGEKGTHLRIS